MADQCHLILHFPDDDMTKFSSHNYQICLANVVDPNKFHNNVLSFVSNIAATITINWNEDYAIAASNKSYHSGVTVSTSTDIEPVPFRSYMVLNQGWSGVTVTPDATLPQGTLEFKNQSGTPVSAIVYKRINGQMAPFHVQTRPLPSGSTEQFMPKLEIAVWLEQDVVTGTVISKTKSEVTNIDFTNRLSATAT